MMTPEGQRLHNARVFAAAASAWLEPPNEPLPCDCCQLDCPECREWVGDRCHGCDKWVERGTLRQSPDPEYCLGAWLECPACYAYTVRLMELPPVRASA